MQTQDGCVRGVCFSQSIFEKLNEMLTKKQGVSFAVATERDSFDNAQKITIRESTAMNIKELDFAFIPCPKFTLKNIEELKNVSTNETVTVKAQIVRRKTDESFMGKTIAVYQLSDSTGTIDIKVWEPRVAHTEGHHYTIKAKLREFQGVQFLQVIY